MLTKNKLGAITCLVGIFAFAQNSYAETRVTFKSAKTTSSYYQMAVQISEAMKSASNGDIIVTVEESQGSVQNVMEAKVRGADYVFTTPPVLVRLHKVVRQCLRTKAIRSLMIFARYFRSRH